MSYHDHPRPWELSGGVEARRFSELKQGHRNTVSVALERESESWRSCSLWWRKGLSKSQREMQAWCRAFIRFKMDILKRDRPVLEALVAWTDGKPYNQFNAPQARFCELLTAACHVDKTDNA